MSASVGNPDQTRADRKIVLALETSCDETAAAVIGEGGRVLGSEVASQILAHRKFGGVVPEVASRNHIKNIRPVIDAALEDAGVSLGEIDAFAATSGPGLASSLLIGNTAAKAFALSLGKPYVAVNHLEGHLLSPFMGRGRGVQACVGLVVSGGHTMLLNVHEAGNYDLLGRTRDDAAGEAFDKAGKMLGLPYPGGPEIEKRARKGNNSRFNFPRSMMGRDGFEFSFSGLKTAVLYTLDKLEKPLGDDTVADLCASFQEAVLEVLVEKSIAAVHHVKGSILAVSGGVSCNGAFRNMLNERCEREGITLLLAEPSLCTDNAAMIGFAGLESLKRNPEGSPLSQDIDPNLRL